VNLYEFLKTERILFSTHQSSAFLQSANLNISDLFIIVQELI